MPRKAKPLRMWAIKTPSGSLLTDSLRPTRQWAKNAHTGYDADCWKQEEADGYRAVRVTVREDER